VSIENKGEKKMNDPNKESELIESPSRRSFLGVSSAALAAAAFAGLTANAQQPEDTRKAEGDHSSSDPGQENKPLLDEKSEFEHATSNRSWGHRPNLVFL
jgi:hypothetical protein